ncbi:Transposase, Mutator family (plasmid) [Tautonia plasticadhaerens]|uniref:Mutator family transposase n=1 Tax=Tautonia plasticadhaerens TaxID=2527974 RepID=A0A518HEQ9_9BACT|nr:transposase [Tautonia plasticadhaerens]QDV39324.1 Transposase, Mutator family [Tautonia plasticadhaerens]
MTHQMQTTTLDEIAELLAEHGSDGLAQAVTRLLNEVMKIERAHALGAAPYQRSEQRTGHANGFKPKTRHTRLGPLTVEVPQTRGVAFYPTALDKGVRGERALKLAVAERDVPGVSTRKVAAITEQLCGLEVTSGEVSRAAAALDEELQRWRDRPIGETPYLVLDARYEHVRHGGQVVSCAVLVAIGIDTQGKRSILGVSVSLSEAEAHWRDFLASLAGRGLHGVRLVVADASFGDNPATCVRRLTSSFSRSGMSLVRSRRRWPGGSVKMVSPSGTSRSGHSAGFGATARHLFAARPSRRSASPRSGASKTARGPAATSGGSDGLGT